MVLSSNVRPCEPPNGEGTSTGHHMDHHWFGPPWSGIVWSFIVRQRRSVNQELTASPTTSSGHDRHRIEFAQSRSDGRTAIRRIFFVRSGRGVIGEAEARKGEDVRAGHFDGLGSPDTRDARAYSGLKPKTRTRSDRPLQQAASSLRKARIGLLVADMDRQYIRRTQARRPRSSAAGTVSVHDGTDDRNKSQGSRISWTGFTLVQVATEVISTTPCLVVRTAHSISRSKRVRPKGPATIFDCAFDFYDHSSSGCARQASLCQRETKRSTMERGRCEKASEHPCYVHPGAGVYAGRCTQPRWPPFGTPPHTAVGGS
ncbi:hypothetical protein C8Q76DRAFT_214543 [Earliella scabrosa]|nr:hypothetical protein C8Q76DRAFT_214543 [Earliella scabrosa]